MDSIFEGVTVSVYKNARSTTPYPKNLIDILTTDYWKDQTEKYRKALPTFKDKAEKSLYKSQKLFAFTASGLFLNERKASLLTKHSGFIAFDIDDDGNPFDPTSIRDSIASLPEVAYCALSVSGNGVWGLIPIAFPDKHKEHFSELEKYFEKLGLKLDKACKDVSRLRFCSYDPEAYIDHQAQVFSALPEVKPTRRQVRKKWPRTFSNSPLETAKRMIAQSIDGQKHDTLLKASRLLGGYVGAGALGEHEAESALIDAITDRIGKCTSKEEKTIRDGLKHGMQAPIYISERAQTRTPQKETHQQKTRAHRAYPKKEQEESAKVPEAPPREEHPQEPKKAHWSHPKKREAAKPPEAPQLDKAGQDVIEYLKKRFDAIEEYELSPTGIKISPSEPRKNKRVSIQTQERKSVIESFYRAYTGRYPDRIVLSSWEVVTDVQKCINTNLGYLQGESLPAILTSLDRLEAIREALTFEQIAESL